ncbi:hypothetical protein FGSG_12104 [Fusarium graminearum PH-1]|uniref:Chromosome 1, complete genome n=1 Tax=Gibberella zeae (strain ATCC MYA-4620 / CBS 123657 / FGSC 9075 / NRRL 31084 / PH-1) TaxID=229533 RepID=I1S5I3_GIBZE|nr:hypothetical protein FGSG_12104 [Fusarium graminearum PH-1]ESU07666.1 hypothetical protein FGSG_12104 [Fusarium graminearum PH-1]CEF74519.1 unnamed protein product [Fusarium graminearum]|eukprot:XP_011318151.1 hypothetical protein FGSG_12104 [Fusarium graminearum PH-1]
MKFSIIATAFLVQGIAAMPWSSVKGSRAKSDEITVRIQVSGDSGHGLASKPLKKMTTTYPICCDICAPEPIPCNDEWMSDACLSSLVKIAN